MREHMGLFRGKRLEDGKWIEGCLVRSEEDVFISVKPKCHATCFSSIRDVGSFTEYSISWFFRVDPDTVGECSGLTDRNGKLIFEGDIVRFTRYDALGWRRDRVGQVLHHQDTASFYVLATTGDGWGWPQIESIEVIGNIHDNPELFGGADNG